MASTSLLVLFAVPCCCVGDCLQSELQYGCDAHRSRYAHICCKVPQPWAEQKDFLRKVRFFEQLEKAYGEADEIVFYDSQCGLPLYIVSGPRAAAGGRRTYSDWKQESLAHGWPSFREDEVVTANVQTHAGYNGEIVSKCNTHLGHNLPDEAGARHCINLMCMAGVRAAGQSASESAADTAAGMDAPIHSADESGQQSSGSGADFSGREPDQEPTLTPDSGHAPPTRAACAVFLLVLALGA